MKPLQKNNNNVGSILIIGIGQSGLSCARYLKAQGYNIAMMDTREQPPAMATIQLEFPEVLVMTGGLDQHLMLQADMIVLSPGVDPRLAEIVAAQQANIEIVGDVELFARQANAPIAAITGSNGKSTVTTLLGEMAVEAGKDVRVGGNLGTPVLELITEPAPDFYIVELSSFQLETVTSLNAFVSTVLNISPDHLDRYDSEQEYKQAKATIYNGNGVMVMNKDDSEVMGLSRADRHPIHFSLQEPDGIDFGVLELDGVTWLAEGQKALIPATDLKIKGKHNIANGLAALAMGSAMGLEMNAMLSALTHYAGLAHRCKYVANIGGVQWFNDSKATNVGACLAAIDGLSQVGKITLIAGGVAKDQDFSALTPLFDKYVTSVILLGQDANKIAEVISKKVNTYFVSNIKQAVQKAQQVTQPDQLVLLSPACASFDMFDSYEHRGDQFEAAVEALL
jgi:UDP-N-acetylmuramoylalanine--D-glutamate ligase